MKCINKYLRHTLYKREGMWSERWLIFRTAVIEPKTVGISYMIPIV